VRIQQVTPTTRILLCKIAIALALAYGVSAAMSCGDDSGGGGGSGNPADASGDPGTVGCLPMPVPAAVCPTPPVTYDNLKPLFQARCVNVCHNGVTKDSNGEVIWRLTELKHFDDWQDATRARIADCSMPPPDAGVPLTIEERQAILEFLKCEFGN
jgi:hypothetical protein